MIDTHSHLFVEEFESDLAEVVERTRLAGVTKVLMPNIDDMTVDAMLKVCAEYPGYCFPMLGFHPTSVDTDYVSRLQRVKERLTPSHPYVAIGEVGMDLYWEQTFVKEQQRVLDEQVQWALDYDLPLVIHCRDAFPELFQVLEPYKGTSLSGVFHSFTGTITEAEEVLSYSRFMLGVNGVVTFKKSHLPDLLRHISLDRLVLETDSPYLAPVPFRGKRNESSYIKNVACKLAEIYKMDLEAIIEVTTKNALKVFKRLE